MALRMVMVTDGRHHMVESDPIHSQEIVIYRMVFVKNIYLQRRSLFDIDQLLFRANFKNLFLI
jgi:hypothetical protein